MKTSTYILFLFCLLLLSCQSSNKNNAEEISELENKIGFNQNREDAAEISFEESYFEYGKINMGDVIEHDFKFTNVGKSDLYVLDAKTSCGCTVPEYSKDAIAPGESGIIKVKFDSEDREGQQDKRITIITNGKNRSVLLELLGYVSNKSKTK